MTLPRTLDGTTDPQHPATTPSGATTRPSPSANRRWWVAVLLLTLLGLGIRLVYVAAFPACDPLTDVCTSTKLSGDAVHYHNAANLLADGKGFIEPYRYFNGWNDVVSIEMADGTMQERPVVAPVGYEEKSAIHPPGYVVYLAAFSVLGFDSVLAHQIASALLGALAVPLLALVGRRLVGDRVGLIAGFLAATYTMLWVNDALVMSETLVIVVVALTILASLRFLRSPDVPSALMFGAVSAVGALTRAEIVLFLPIVAAVVLLRSPMSWRRRAGIYAVCGFTALGVLSPWLVRNLTTFEHPVLLSNGAGTVLVQTNCDPVYYGDLIGYWNLECGLPFPYGPNGEMLDESERDVIVRERASEYISSHRARLLTAVIPARVGRMFSVFHPIQQLELDKLADFRPYRISVSGLVEYYALVPFMIAGAVALWRRRLPLIQLATWVGLVAFTAALAFGNMRYRVSAEPALVVLAAVGIDVLWSRVRARPAGSEGGTIAAYPVIPAADRRPTAAHRVYAAITGTVPRRGLPWRRWIDADTPPATAPTGRGTPLPRLPALDGLRGLAVIGVLLYHGGYAWAKGGFLGVSTFFTLSGFLITNLLVREFDRSRTIRLGSFWVRRFRRLLPAALAALFGVALYGVWFATPEQLANLRGDLVAALFYVANWRFILAGTSYGDLFSAPSPVQHFWSLAIEEQFYVLFPLLVFGVLRFRGRRALWAVLAVAAAASVVTSFVVSENIDQLYYGTHTRAFELLAGALLALWWSGRSRTSAAITASTSWFDRRSTTAVLTAAGLAALAATLVAWNIAEETSVRLGRGGLALHAVLVCVVIVAIARRGPLASLLSFAPLRWVGLISYGLYLYHWPVFLVLDTERTGLTNTPLFAVRMVVTLALAVISYLLLELPIRHGRRLRAPRRALVAAPVVALAVLVAAIAVTHDPPPSTIAYADAEVGEFNPIVDVVEPVPTQPVDPSAPTTTAVPVTAPATVLIVGDSGMTDAAPAVGAAFKAAGTTKVVDGTTPGLGLTKDIDWRRAWAQMVDDHHPDLVLVMLGGWDSTFIEEHGDQAYVPYVDDAVHALTGQGARVLWLSMLPGGQTPERAADRVFSQLPHRYPGIVEYWDIEPVLRGPDGDWPRSIPGPDGTDVLVRKPDVWHLCPEGALRVATAAVDRAVDLGWSGPSLEPWTAGDWRDEARYNDPPRGCVPPRS